MGCAVNIAFSAIILWLWCPASEVRYAWISRFTSFQIDQDASKAWFSSVV
jgi:hypothetical protein